MIKISKDMNIDSVLHLFLPMVPLRSFLTEEKTTVLMCSFSFLPSGTALEPLFFGDIVIYEDYRSFVLQTDPSPGWPDAPQWLDGGCAFWGVMEVKVYPSGHLIPKHMVSPCPTLPCS